MSFKNEKEFRLSLVNLLNKSKLVINDNDFSIEAKDHIRRKDWKDIPDITVYVDKIPMKWRSIDKEFFIECKIDINEVRDSYSQFFRYKYKLLSETHKKLEKYGDYHVVVTCPEFFDKDIRDMGSKDSWISNFSLTRFLWKCGFGVMGYSERYNKIIIAFNEQEVVIVDSIQRGECK